MKILINLNTFNQMILNIIIANFTKKESCTKIHQQKNSAEVFNNTSFEENSLVHNASVKLVTSNNLDTQQKITKIKQTEKNYKLFTGELKRTRKNKFCRTQIKRKHIFKKD